MKKLKKQNFTYAVGRRKTSSVRIRLFKGRGENLVNGLPLDQYFPGTVNKSLYEKPFNLLEVHEKYYVTAIAKGGGKSSQLEALVHALSRAFSKSNTQKFRQILKKEGLLKRDSRIRERRKIGMGGKARRKKQSPKR